VGEHERMLSPSFSRWQLHLGQWKDMRVKKKVKTIKNDVVVLAVLVDDGQRRKGVQLLGPGPRGGVGGGRGADALEPRANGLCHVLPGGGQQDFRHRARL